MAAPRRSHRDVDKAGAMADPLVLYTHVNEQAFLRDSLTTGQGRSTSKFSVSLLIGRITRLRVLFSVQLLFCRPIELGFLWSFSSM